jgi:hypothetical protein
MRGLLPHLHRITVGLAVAGSLFFGVAQAFAAPAELRRDTECRWTGGIPHPPNDRCYSCGEYGGYCDGFGLDCVCYTGK